LHTRAGFPSFRAGRGPISVAERCRTGCRACEPVCPAGVRYGALLEEWREQSWNGSRRPFRLRALMWAVNGTLRVRALGLARRHARTRVGSQAEQQHLMLGCFERALYPRVSRAVRILAPGLSAPAAQGCCGALHAHNGELERGRELARELGEALPGVIVTTAGGCAAHLASVLGTERVKELSQCLAEAPDAPESSPARLRVGLQDSCHLRTSSTRAATGSSSRAYGAVASAHASCIWRSYSFGVTRSLTGAAGVKVVALINGRVRVHRSVDRRVIRTRRRMKPVGRCGRVTTCPRTYPARVMRIAERAES